MAADVKSLCEFLAEAELQQYYSALKSELKILTVAHLKYASDEDLKQLGLSRPEVRRLRKFYDKYYPNGYLGKIKRLLQSPKPEMFHTSSSWQSADNYKVLAAEETEKAPPSNKHIIPADAITINKRLGVGEFGIVQQGVWTVNGNERRQVAIKCLCKMQSNPIEFLKEASIMHAIEHENIVRFYGVVLDTDCLLVTELAPLRSLLECLKDSGLKVSFLTVPTLCEFALQICNGMMYLENKRLIHRDLAARNILVFNKDKVKISDFGLSRSLGVGKDYYQTNFNVNLKLPIAWCAPECINFLRFTNASDVWAYGVCLWEMFSYGFQPWAALTGHQILEAIDEPNFQRLDQPDCCPKEYYSLMLKCWQHDPLKRPRFVDIYAMLPDLRPEQVKTIAGQEMAKKDHLMYRQNEIITVLDKEGNAPLWRGVLNTGKTGLFNPANTVTYLSQVMLPSTTNPFTRTFERGSKRRLRSEMISKPQNDLKHTGHIGIDGAFFGDISFLTSPSTPPACSSIVPRQVVTPYKPSEDIEQTPLLTPTSPDSVQANGNYFPSGAGGTFQQHGEGSTSFVSRFDFTNPLQGKSNGGSVFDPEHPTSSTPARPLSQVNSDTAAAGNSNSGGRHEYHEISDEEEVLAPDLGLSLTDEMEQMFQSMSATSIGGNIPGNMSSSYDFDRTNKQNEAAELTASKCSSKLNLPLNCSSLYRSKKKAGMVKPLSVKDDKILSHAIEIANEISARSMNDLVQDASTSAQQSPRRKFSFKFPLGHHATAGGAAGVGGPGESRSLDECGSGREEGISNKFGAAGRHFSDELKNVTDIQESITDEHRMAYNSLVQKPSTGSAVFKQQLNDLEKSWRNGNEGGFSGTSSSLHTLPKSGTSTRPPNLNIAGPAHDDHPNKENHSEGLPCESPSYLTSNEVPLANRDLPPSNNPPLPPRDRLKPSTLPNQKRHVRKHALIIPATGTLRTLDKLGANHLSEENRLRLKTVADKSKMDLHSDTNLNKNSDAKIHFGTLAKIQVVESVPPSPAYQVYQNFSIIPHAADSASVNFENIVERKDLNNVTEFFENGHGGAPVVDCDRVDGVTEANENVPAENGTTEGAPVLSNSVSCEDLLEFSEKKPNGRERGAESDEVRIMIKVLGPKMSPEYCLAALDILQWTDVHKAIKIVKLYNLMDKRGPFRDQMRLCAEQLENNDWNLQDTAIHM